MDDQELEKALPSKKVKRAVVVCFLFMLLEIVGGSKLGKKLGNFVRRCTFALFCPRVYGMAVCCHWEMTVRVSSVEVNKKVSRGMQASSKPQLPLMEVFLLMRCHPASCSRVSKR
ncbi:hypothetical protein R1flu_025882 [Riccia fluitans]|uniref:Uncharacterized protein n=1 Tax=Riccia fluitans TaxID=41844 RepID=A0ABD1XZ02_9MARC